MTLSQEQKDIFDLINNGEAFQNPQQDNITNLKDIISQEIPNIQTLTNITPSEITDIEDALNDLDVTLNDFNAHTNRLSGVTFSGLGTAPDVHNLFGVSHARQVMQRELEIGTDEDALEKGLELFGSVCEIHDTEFETIANYILSIFTKVDSPSGQLLEVLDIIDRINEFRNRLDNQMSSDTSAYNAAINELRRFGLMHTVASKVPYLDTIKRTLSHCNTGTSELNRIIDLILG